MPNTVPFPVQPDGPAPKIERGARIETRPIVGYAGQTLEYQDAERIPRIELRVDDTMPEEDVRFLRKVIQSIGDRLPPRPASASVLGPRLMPALVVGFQFLFELPPLCL